MKPEDIKAADEAAVAAAKQVEEAAKIASDAAAAAAAQDPTNTELEKVSKAKKTELEQAIYKRGIIDKRIVELGGQSIPAPSKSAPIGDDDDSKPLTRGDLKRMQQQDATKSAMELADALTDDSEKTLVKDYLANKIKPSGNPQEDFQNALALANSLRNKQFLEEAARKGIPKRTTSAPGGPGKGPEEPFVPTAEESVFMRPPYNLTKEKILAVRAKSQNK